MPNTFKATGHLSLAKSTERAANYEEVLATSPDGWDRRILRMRLSTDKGPLYLTLRGFKKHDDSNVINFSELVNGSYNRISIPFKERFQYKAFGRVANSSLFSVDTETDPAYRRKLKDGLRNGNLSISESDAQAQLDESLAKRYYYISNWDYVEKVKQLLDEGFFKNLTVTVKGEISVSIYKDKYYFNYEPHQIYTALNSDEKVATSSILFYYDKDVLEIAEDSNSISLHGFIQFYDSKLGDTAFAPYDILYQINPNDSPERKEKRIDYIRRRFEVIGDSVNVMGLVVENINYAPKRAITKDDLTDAEKEAIEMGDTTLEKVLSSKESEVRDEYVRANVYKEVQSKYINRSVESGYRSVELYGLSVEDDEDELPF